MKPSWSLALAGLAFLLRPSRAGLSSPSDPGDLCPLEAVVFYDENANGILDPGEGARLPEVLVEVGERTGRSQKKTGRVVIPDVPRGTYLVSLRRETLPPFYIPGPPLTVGIPHTGEIGLPATLPIGPNRPNSYMAFGDSITEGDGSSDGAGYRGRLQDKLKGHFGRGFVINEGASGTTSERGVRRIARALTRNRPAYTLIVYGTNDWTDEHADLTAARLTTENLRRIVRRVRRAQSLPFIATIVPASGSPRAPDARNQWVAQVNELVRAMVREEGVPLVDLHAAFLRQGDLRRLFVDDIHPNDEGYEIIATAFFDAIAHADPATPMRSFSSMPPPAGP